jgi:hypothetical protein
MQWYMPVIPATKKVEIRGIVVFAQAKLVRLPSQQASWV